MWPYRALARTTNGQRHPKVYALSFHLETEWAPFNGIQSDFLFYWSIIARFLSALMRYIVSALSRFVKPIYFV